MKRRYGSTEDSPAVIAERTKRVKAFDTEYRKVEKLIQAVADGDASIELKTAKAINSLEDRVWQWAFRDNPDLDSAAKGAIKNLRVRFRRAKDDGFDARQMANRREMARLREEEAERLRNLTPHERYAREIAARSRYR